MYTSIFKRGSYLYVRGVRNGSRYNEKIQYQPTLYISAQRKGQVDTGWKTLEGNTVYEIQPGSMRDCNDYIEEYKEVHGVTVYGPPDYQYQYIAETFPGEIKWNSADIKIAIIDIETTVENGFPEPELAQEEILLITVMDFNTRKFVTFGCRPYAFAGDRKDAQYIQCKDEPSLLREFLNHWASNYPDAVSGWNSTLFDLPYLYNRILRVLGETSASRLSPHGHTNVRMVKIGNKEEPRAEIAGVNRLDYLDLYKKFTYGAQESYRLDYIAEQEIGEKKHEMPGTSFKDNYTNHWDEFVKYNIIDVELVARIDDKMKFFDLCFTLAYDAKILPEDVYSPVKMWDNIIYNYLRERNTVIPNRKRTEATSYEGGYVKDPLVGKHRWACSFDLNSLYPHLIMQYNMSPETMYIDQMNVHFESLLNKEADLSFAHDNNLAIAANGCMFHKDHRGLLPSLMQYYYDRRVTIKSQMLLEKQAYENDKDSAHEKEIARLNNMQMAVKIALNSAYGAFANAWFRYSDVRIAEGITKSGQLAIRWVANRLNKFLDKLMETDGVDRVVLIDTDSVVLTLEDIVESKWADKSVEEKIKMMDQLAEKVIQPFINKVYQELADYTNAYEQKMQMKRENLADVMISVAKKRYVMNVHNSEGVQYAKPKMKVMGLAMVRSSTPSAIRDSLRDALPVIMHGNETDVNRYVSEFKEKFMAMDYTQIAFPRGCNNMKEYQDNSSIYKKATPIAVRGALLYNFHLKRLGLSKKYESIKDGDKVKFIYLKKQNPIAEDVIAFPDKIPEEFGLNSFIDYNKMFEKTFVDGVQNVLDPLGWHAEARATLEDFFS